MLLRASGRGFLAWLILATTSSGTSSSTTTIESPTTCQVRNINYVTNTLPQQCYKISWRNSDPLGSGVGKQASTQDVDESRGEIFSAHAAPTGGGETREQTPAATVTPTKTVDEDPGSPTFISFEDWKDLKAREAGRDVQDQKQESERALSGPQADGGLREESDIALKVEAVSEELSSIAAPLNQPPTGSVDTEQQYEAVLYSNGKTQYYRSKDAGKTCKERFSYSSFDAGATVLKTNNGAKNAKAILVENKDSYMLLECAANNKFAIVELTDDILIDTVVLANFEFFSSMIRHFRVSVSDRYPVKVDKWKDLGTFEAKNSRDIQPFFVQNPLIWAKYVRIEFLSHYGNEYYCPVSLLRVHGTRMLESWKETEAPSEEDEIDEGNLAYELPPSNDVGQLGSGSGHESDGSIVAQEIDGGHKVISYGNTSTSSRNGHPLIYEDPRDYTCPADTIVATSVMSRQISGSPLPSVDGNDSSVHSSVNLDDVHRLRASSTVISGGFQASPSSTDPYASTPPASSIVATSTIRPTSAPQSSSAENTPNTSSGSPKKPSPVAQAPPRSKNSTSTLPSPPSPTVQESFHKAVSKRLQLLESNITLSLEYLEEQSRFLQQSQQASERRQLAKVDSLLDSLNRTVLSELRNVRQQYDQIWQSTIIALESQRDQSQRELVALGSRMNVLADEVVFQKRMAILQAILLLSCLVMVIFSRTAVSVPSNQPDMAFTSNQLRRSRLAQALYSSGLSPRHHHLPAAIVEDDFEGESQNQGLEYDVSEFSEAPQHNQEEGLPNVHRHSGIQPARSVLDDAPVTVEQIDAWFPQPQDKGNHHSEISTTQRASATHLHNSRAKIPNLLSERLSPPSSSDAQDTHSDEGDTTSSNDGGLHTPPSPFAQLMTTHDGVAGMRKPLPALPEDSSS